jgi:hypothetical protein
MVRPRIGFPLCRPLRVVVTRPRCPGEVGLYTFSDGVELRAATPRRLVGALRRAFAGGG